MRIKARGSPLKISKLSCQTTKIGSKQRRSTIWNHASLRYTINETSEVRFAIYACNCALRINLQHASAPSPCAANDNVNDHRAATSDSPFQNARTSPLRVHRIVIPRLRLRLPRCHPIIPQARLMSAQSTGETSCGPSAAISARHSSASRDVAIASAADAMDGARLIPALQATSVR